MEARIMTTQHRSTRAARSRRGFSLIEVMVALSLLVVVVLGMAMTSSKAARGVSDAGARARAQAMADQQIALARAWSNYPTLSELAGSTYNLPADGLTPVTSVQPDSTNGVRVTTVTVTVTGAAKSGLTQPVIRRITIAAP
jgi:prepilin-type N-terminal cleavage/methylation domain-containing protein